MNPLKSKNIVAKIIQVYACVNAAVWVIVFFVIASEVNVLTALAAFVVGVFVSFLLYAFGEIIDLLQEIKTNTYKPSETVIPDELPEL